MEIDVIVPTYDTSEEQINILKKELASTAVNKINFIIIRKKQSVVKNRLDGLKKSNKKIVFMCDDDIHSLDIGWDEKMLDALKAPEIGLVGVNVIDDRRNMSTFGDITSYRTHVCGCLFAYKRNDDLYQFDDNYIGSQIEDTDFMKQIIVSKLLVLYLGDVRIKHRFEGKGNKKATQNRQYFFDKWGHAP